jgi:hypothetical protein
MRASAIGFATGLATRQMQHAGWAQHPSTSHLASSTQAGVAAPASMSGSSHELYLCNSLIRLTCSLSALATEERERLALPVER